MEASRNVDEVYGSSFHADSSHDESENNRTYLGNSSFWKLWGHKVPKGEVVYFCQVFIIYIVIITCIANLTIGRDEGKVWIALLSSCLGYLLPNPSIKSNTPK